MERLLAAPAEILAAVAHAGSLRQTVGGVVAALQRATGLDAVGLRLKEGEDYPFLGALGYSDEFLRAEDSLVARYPDGGLCRDPDGLPQPGVHVRPGRARAHRPRGPAVHGRRQRLDQRLAAVPPDVPPEQDPRLNPRNRCIHAGFRSIALVPLRAGDEILGLLHLADRRPDRFTPGDDRLLRGTRSQHRSVSRAHPRGARRCARARRATASWPRTPTTGSGGRRRTGTTSTSPKDACPSPATPPTSSWPTPDS